MKCTKCNVGPGKFEGEPTITFLAHQCAMEGMSDESVGSADFFVAPFNFDADTMIIDMAREYGYCDDCIGEAMTDGSYGLQTWVDSHGFVYSETYTNKDEYVNSLKCEIAISEESEDFE